MLTRIIGYSLTYAALCVLVGCASPVNFCESASGSLPETFEHNSRGVWAVEIVDCIGGQCKSELLVQPPQNRSSRSFQLFDMTNEVARGATPYLKRPGPFHCNLQALNTGLEDLRRQAMPDGDVAIVTISTSERFGIGLSQGACSAKLRVYRAQTDEPIYTAEATTTRTTPVLWLLNYHELSGRLNSDGECAARQAVSNVFEGYASKRAGATKDAVAAKNSSAVQVSSVTQ